MIQSITKITVPAVPNAEVGLNSLKYRLSKNLPKVNNMDIQFAQSAVFTPSDFAFPTNAVKAEATPNTEMVLVVDVDLHLLDELHHYGTVKVLKDRRNDLYQVKLLK